MALKKDLLIKQLKALHWTEDMITKYVESTDEVDVPETELPAVTVYDTAGRTTLETNLKDKYERETREATLRTLTDDFELGLSAKDAKDKDKVKAALKAKIAPGSTPKDWEDKFKTLQDAATTHETTANDYKTKYETLVGEREYRQLFWPEMSDSLDDEEWIVRLKKNFQIKADSKGIVGLFDNATQKFIEDDKANTIPVKEAWAAERKKDKYKNWHKEDKPDPTLDDKKKTHAVKNSANGGGKPKYADFDAIMAEVDKKYPKDKTPGRDKQRRDYVRTLQSQMA
jgi:hypothetical protein